MQRSLTFVRSPFAYFPRNHDPPSLEDKLANDAALRRFHSLAGDDFPPSRDVRPPHLLAAERGANFAK